MKKGQAKEINEAVVQSMKCDHRKVRQENMNYRNERRRPKRNSLKRRNKSEKMKEEN